MKFDLFDESTWVIDQSYLERELSNKALGQIGSLIGEIRTLKESLSKTVDPTTVDEYNIAEALKNRNPEAFRIMEISYEMPDFEIKTLLMKIDFVLNVWKSVEARHTTWKTILFDLKYIVPYLTSHVSNNNPQYVSRTGKTITLTVHGNEAWKAYLASQVTVGYLGKRTDEYREMY